MMSGEARNKQGWELSDQPCGGRHWGLQWSALWRTAAVVTAEDLNSPCHIHGLPAAFIAEDHLVFSMDTLAALSPEDTSNFCH